MACGNVPAGRGRGAGGGGGGRVIRNYMKPLMWLGGLGKVLGTGDVMD